MEQINIYQQQKQQYPKGDVRDIAQDGQKEGKKKQGRASAQCNEKPAFEKQIDVEFSK